MNYVWKGLMFLVIAGVCVALFRVFDGNIFGIFDWIWSWGTTIVNNIANFFTGRPEFQEIVQAPEIISFLKN